MILLRKCPVYLSLEVTAEGMPKVAKALLVVSLSDLLTWGITSGYCKSTTG
jgi:hypothetical protein